MNIVVLTGGVGGAKFLLGVKSALGWSPFGDRPASARDHVAAVVNTADDIRLNGLQICPDLDSCMYTLSGASDLARGWGQSDETWVVSTELAAYGADAPWFSLGDKDIATHIVRTRMLAEGAPLSEVTAALTERRRTGVQLLPMTDGRVATVVDVDEPALAIGTAPARISLHFQEWWVRYRATLPPHRIRVDGAEDSRPAPEVLEAIEAADLILIAPSNPVVSIGTILSVPGIRSALQAASAPIIGVSPIIGGAPLRGYADVCLAAINVACSAEGVGRLYGARAEGGILDGYLVAPGETFKLPGVRVVEAPLLMTDPAATAEMVRQCIELGALMDPRAGK
ncbi:2-phospho-L-lactate transferase [Arthrobacter sp. AETb3-4]|uniref:2-phospho-L-lactate transferase n=1 Tax=Arthrobacter wenxiniae TaxID=2713570 RepID=A0A7Y7IFK8_9MICC|nr:2-phospho-L-lactate transferase [Arthrobacter wenxiniae]